jgi:small ligand-binding sensory domain FIST
MPMSTRAGVGISALSEAPAAARAAARDALERSAAGRADWGLVFITAAHRPRFAEMLAAIQKTLGTDLIAGCSAAGVLTGSEEIEARPGVVVLACGSDRMRGQTVYAAFGDGEPRAAAREVASQLAGRGEGLLVLLPDPAAARPDHLLHELGRALPGTEAIGGAASGDPALAGTFQFYGRNVASRALAGLHLSGDLRRTIGVTQGCQPLGSQTRITAGDGNVILEVDGRPALEVLRSRLPGPLADSLERLGGHLFVGLPPDPNQDTILPGEYLVRQLLGIDESRGALVVAATVRAGEPLHFVLRDPQAARDDLKEMLKRLAPAAASGACRFGLYFNCAGRGTSLYGMPGIDTAYISAALGDLPIAGFFGNAEIAPLRGQNRLFTYTGVLALIGDGGAPSASSPGV